MRRLYRLFQAAVCLLVACVATSQAFAQDKNLDQLAVTLQSGRTFLGSIDSRTDEGRLWLRIGETGATVTRPIDWQQITEVIHDEETVDVAGFRQAAISFAVERRQLEQREQRAQPLPTPDDESAAEDVVTPEPMTAAAIQQTAAYAPQMVQSIYVEAYVANWDRDVEVDGVVVLVQPLDEYGQVIEVSGTVDVDLIAQRHSRRFEPTEPFPQIARWSQAVYPAQMKSDGYMLKLPYQSVHPEFDREIDPFGLVHVRMAIAGHGVFEASSAMVRLRPYSSVRDHQQQWRGRRFFHQEMTGRGDRGQLSWPVN